MEDELAKRVVDPGSSTQYPTEINTPGRRAIYRRLRRQPCLQTLLARAGTGGDHLFDGGKLRVNKMVSVPERRSQCDH